jgi:hypothetical protein
MDKGLIKSVGNRRNIKWVSNCAINIVQKNDRIENKIDFEKR